MAAARSAPTPADELRRVEILTHRIGEFTQQRELVRDRQVARLQSPGHPPALSLAPLQPRDRGHLA